MYFLRKLKRNENSAGVTWNVEGKPFEMVYAKSVSIKGTTQVMDFARNPITKIETELSVAMGLSAATLSAVSIAFEEKAIIATFEVETQLHKVFCTVKTGEIMLNESRPLGVAVRELSEALHDNWDALAETNSKQLSIL